MQVAKPLIFTVDDDLVVLNAIERDLRKKYGRDYRIVKADSGAAALNAAGELRKRGEIVAAFVADQRMPQMTGVQFLEAARALYPEARKILLTAYADTEAAIHSINRVGLDYYLMKPWDPPEDHLYPMLDDLLEEWKAHVRLPFEGIRVAGTLWSNESHEIKDFLVRQQIPYQWLDVESDAEARALVEQQHQGELRIPTVFFPDGSFLAQPDLRSLAEKVGLQTRAALPFYDVVILGGGPAGLAAAVYASSEGLRCLLIEKHAPGGQAGSSPKIENYLGFPVGISGGDLTRRAMVQARRFGAEILSTQEATRVRRQDPYRVVTLADGAEVSCHAVLLATGASFHTLNMPGAAELTGRGIYYGAAHTEAHFYKDQAVFVVGGANSAGQGAMFLSRFARSVTMLIRGTEPTASQYLQDALKQNEKIEILLNTDLIEVCGEDRLEAVVVKNSDTGEVRKLDCAALFVFIGVRPQSDLVADLVLRDPKGYVLTGPDLVQGGKRPVGWPLDRDPFMCETSVPGLFAAGDVRFGTNHRVASASGEGGIAVAMIRQYLKRV
ncbi:MAG TPA: FAD-dependent oxidoreductase [Anaerolineae bacterium]|nr:FAD-dependent oxidoreductase [Anaerolineae bacterium]